MTIKKLLAYLPFFLLVNVSNAQQFLERTLVHDNETRRYSIYVPASYDENISFPLLFNFHGGGGDIASQIAIADMRGIADTANFIIVYPQALPDPNDEGSTNWLHKAPTSVDDIFFVEAMIEEISLQYQVDSTRIYACGYSLGGEFTYELACRLSHKIAAVGIVARTMYIETFNRCDPKHPLGIITILGTDDFISPYGGLVFNGTQFYLSADEVHDYWSAYNATSTTPNITLLPNINSSDGSSVERQVWENGTSCVTVEHLKVIGGGHDWPGSFGNMDIDASLEIWNYVSKYNTSGLIACDVTSTSKGVVEKDKLIIYPNPVTHHLSIDINSTENQEYQIYGQRGDLLLSGKMVSGNNRIDVSILPTGIYFLQVKNTIRKFIKTQ